MRDVRAVQDAEVRAVLHLPGDDGFGRGGKGVLHTQGEDKNNKEGRRSSPPYLPSLSNMVCIKIGMHFPKFYFFWKQHNTICYLEIQTFILCKPLKVLAITKP